MVALNLGTYDSSEVSDELSFEYGISTRPGAHCAPLMHQSMGTVDQGMVRFSFSWFNTEEEIDAAVKALKELAELNLMFKKPSGFFHNGNDGRLFYRFISGAGRRMYYLPK